MTSRNRYGLWVLIAGPLIWSGHFLISYMAAAIHCAKRPDIDLGSIRLLILAATIAALLGIVATGVHGLRHHLRSTDGLPHGDDSAQDRQSFLGFATLLLCGLSGVAVVFVALPIAFFEVCV